MFDPHRLLSRNRRIQKRAQVLQPKGIFTPPVDPITRKDLEEYQRILIANKMTAYIPTPPYPAPVTNVLFSSSSSALANPLIEDFTFSSEAKNIAVGGYILIFTPDPDENRLDIRVVSVSALTSVATPPNSYYYLGDAVNMSEVTIFNNDNILILIDVPTTTSTVTAQRVSLSVPLNFIYIPTSE